MAASAQAAILLLNHYAALECASAEMLAAAQAGDWESVVRLESASAVVLARLHQIGEQTSLTRDQQLQRARILQVILSNDVEICQLCRRAPLQLDISCMPTVPVHPLLH